MQKLNTTNIEKQIEEIETESRILINMLEQLENTVKNTKKVLDEMHTSLNKVSNSL